MTWTPDIEQILNDVRENSIYLATFHKRNFFYFKRVSTYFRLPTIMISAIASVASVGLTAYISQQHISAIVCLMSLSVGIINSVELYLRLADNLEIELNTSKKYYALSIDLHKLLNLSQTNREGDPKEVLNQFYIRYTDLVEESNLLSAYYPDKLAKLPKIKSIFKRSQSSTSSNSSLNSNPMVDEPDTHVVQTL
jgi:hypothetical protein